MGMDPQLLSLCSKDPQDTMMNKTINYKGFMFSCIRLNPLPVKPPRGEPPVNQAMDGESRGGK